MTPGEATPGGAREAVRKLVTGTCVGLTVRANGTALSCCRISVTPEDMRAKLGRLPLNSKWSASAYYG